MRLGIDFAGGTEVAVRFTAGDADEGKIRDVAESCGVQVPTVVRYGETSAPEFLIRFNRVGDSNEEECPTPADAGAGRAGGGEDPAAPSSEAKAASERLATSS